MLTAAPLWLLLALGLLALVLMGIDSDGLLLLGGLAGLILALVSSLLVLPPVVQVLLWGALVAGGYGLLRRWSARHGERTIPPAAGAEQAEVIAGFDAQGLGRVRWQGQSWAALNVDPHTPLNPGERVTVMGRDGNCLQVMARKSP